MEFKIKMRRGIDDLKSLYAFHGNSQGDHSKSNDISDYIASKGWMSYGFDVPMTEEDIAAEIVRRRKWNNNYIKELEKSGEFGKEEFITVSMEFNPALDTPLSNSYPLSSYSMIFLDLTK